MSFAGYELGGLRFWTEQEIELREMFQQRTVSTVKRVLSGINPAWSFQRVEGPCLALQSSVSTSYDESDIFVTNHKAKSEFLALRPETTHSSYVAARKQQAKFPHCVWQSGKSFRRETNDGASAAKLRFNEFWQLEFQCIYRNDTKADYKSALIDALVFEVRRFCMSDVRVIDSDRLPSYSTETKDIECLFDGKWKEVASCSTRTDFSDDHLVCEIAFGLDRIATIAS